MSKKKTKESGCRAGMIVNAGFDEEYERRHALRAIPPTVTFECDTEGKMVSVSTNAHTVFGYPVSERLETHTLFDLIHSDERERARAYLDRARNGATDSGDEYTAVRGDGAAFPVLITLHPAAMGTPSPRLFGVVVDLSDRRAALRELQYYRRVVECLDEPVAVVDREFRVQLANSAFRSGYGADGGEDSFFNTLEAEMDSAATENLRQHIMAMWGECARFEASKPGPDGDRTELRISVMPIPGEEGEVRESVVVVRDITRIKRAERTLREQEEFRRLMLDAIPVPVLLRDENGVIAGCNRACELFSGIDRSRVIGKHVSDMAEEEREILSLLEQNLLRPGEPVIETSLERKNGLRHDILLYRTSYRDGTGRTGGLVGVVMDISGRKRVERELRESSEVLEGIFSAVNVHLAYMDTNFTFIRVNRAFSESENREPVYFAGKNYFDIFPRDENQEIFRKVVETGISYHAYARPAVNPEHPEGGASYWDWSLETVNDTRSNVIGLLLMRVYVTEQERSRLALRESEERLRSIFSNMPVPTTMFQKINGNYEVVDYNRAADRFTGGKIRTLLGKTDNEVFRDRPDLLALLTQSIADQTVLNVETPYRFVVTGDERYIHFTFAYVYKDLALSHWQDITERKRTVDRLMAYQSRLQSLSSELTFAEERERRRVAEYLHDRIGINLSLSQMRLETLRNQMDQPEELDEIIDLLNRIVNETRTLTFELSPPVLYELGLESALDWLAEQWLRNFGIPVAIRQEGAAVKPDLDIAILLFQSVKEILSNVAKHARANKVDVTIQWLDNSIRITVRDNGIGFDTSILQPSADETKGFGLFQIGERIRFVGGLLDIESAPGEGTRVTLTTPLTNRRRKDAITPDVKWFS